LNKERPALNLPRDIAGLRAECKKRQIDTSGSKQDVRSSQSQYCVLNQWLTELQLITRIQTNDLSTSRAFSTETQRRPTPTSSSTSSTPTRHFNTSRALKAVGDSSTIDFAYLPTSDDMSDTTEVPLRVPIMPDNYDVSSAVSDEDIVVMKPEISTMSADAVFLPMSELTDNHAMNIDFHAMADRVAANLRQLGREGGLGVEEQASIMKQVWADLVDDVVKAVGGKKVT
jgi:hypothetical protein